jgi:hypothetical protein
VTASIFALLGVIVGALLNGGVGYLQERRTRAARVRSNAMLLAIEQVYQLAAVELALESGKRLRWDVDLSSPVWRETQSVLGELLDPGEWMTIAAAELRVAATAGRLGRETDSALTEGEVEDLQRARKAVAKSLAVLARRAGLPREAIGPPAT